MRLAGILLVLVFLEVSASGQTLDIEKLGRDVASVDTEVREAALDALLWAKSSHDRDHLLAHLTQDPDPDLRVRSLRALTFSQGARAKPVPLRAKD
jgi:hypothetical protein